MHHLQSSTREHRSVFLGQSRFSRQSQLNGLGAIAAAREQSPRCWSGKIAGHRQSCGWSVIDLLALWISEFDDTASSRRAAGLLADELGALVKGTSINVEVQQNIVAMHPPDGESFVVTCGEQGRFRIRSLRATRGFPQQVHVAQPEWSDNDIFDKPGMLFRAERWIARQRSNAA
jgi:hypothetical protein